MHRITSLLILAMLPFANIACSESNTSDAKQAGSMPTSWLLQSEPSGAKGVGEVKADALENAQVVVRGRIGGRMEPLTAQSPVFIIVDLKIPHCGELPDDHCKTPWDYCCEPRDSLTAHSATVQLVAPDGSPLDVDPVAAGLRPLDEVVVVGSVGPRPGTDVLTIRATGVYRTGQPSQVQ